MDTPSGAWTIVLASGDGSRLSRLTTTDKGETIPKQFCSLASRECLLELALRRAAGISSHEQVCTIVAAQHRRWWREPLKGLRPGNIIVQPQNRGTAVGTALALLRVEKHDPSATVVLLPADHYVEDEETLSRSLVELAAAAKDDPLSVYLLGAQPDAPDSELGYIVPLGKDPNVRTVAKFVEKPSLDDAGKLMAEGALWNMFIVAGSASGLLSMLESSYNFVAPMRIASAEPAVVGGLSRLYEDLPAVDLSRDVLAHFPQKLKVLSVPHCGWTDLGTPKRVAATVRKGRAGHGAPASPAMYWDLAKSVGATQVRHPQLGTAKKQLRPIRGFCCIECH